ncbi:MAG: hypothetical protein JWM93_3134 [Frankiales bacterium]|nr:hypothetical protein [Frankiales bacterium]
MGDIEMVRGIVRDLPRSYEVIVRDRVKFRVGQLVHLAFARDEQTMGFAFPKEEREAMIAGDPETFLWPVPGDLRYNWLELDLVVVNDELLRELVLDAWRMVVPKKVARDHLGA